MLSGTKANTAKKLNTGAPSSEDIKTEPDKTIGSSAELEPFVHWCWQFDNFLFVINPAQIDHSDEAKRYIYRFLLDVFRACKTYQQSDLSKHKAKPYKPSFVDSVFSWPPKIKMPNGINQQEMAFSTEQSFIAALADQQTFDFVLLLSDDLLPSLIPEAVDHYQRGKLQNKPLLCLESVENYFAEPAKKAKLWQALKSFL